MNEIERKQKIYQELLEEAKKSYPKKLPGEFTIIEFANDGDVTIDKARRFLRQMVQEGRLSCRKTNRGMFYSVV